MPYQPQRIEPKWQRFWEEKRPFRAETGAAAPKYYVLDMFPYPSSAGLHVGHPEGYTATDIVARYRRARGFNVLHPMGWDAFGLPAEQYAIQTGIHPRVTTMQAIENFRRQLKMLGFSYDWEREISTCDPSYYRWTQYIFLKLFERGLAYQREELVNFCPALGTVLANDEVIDGKSERGGHPVYRIPMKQWLLRITSYAERLLRDLDRLDWPESTKELQRNWIGRSEGLRARFPLRGPVAGDIEIFTTRPDTIFGATYLVLAPEHPLVTRITTPEQRAAVEDYIRRTSQKSELARQEQVRDKTGVFTGAWALNPFSGEDIPVWIADYVLPGYGTGAIMAVPAHDERDYDFARAMGLPIRRVVEAHQGDEGAYTGEGVAINSGFINGLPTPQAKAAVIRWAEEHGIGHSAVQYRLRDWLFSRQRYWGEPIPILHLSDGALRAVPEDQLPVLLPEVSSYEPTGTGQSPLAAIADWVHTVDPVTGQPARRETDTMPGSAGSSWYFLRFCDPHNDREPFGMEAARYWMPVDLYIGGDEHAVGHLLYARFWTKVLYDAGLCPVDEPFQRLVHQGMILGEDGQKMSKRFGNVINPDDVVRKYGADTLRVYEMFMGPLERDKPWSTQAVEGVYRFLQRTWRLFVAEQEQEPAAGEKDPAGSQGQEGPVRCAVDEEEPRPEDLRLLHKTIRKVTEDIEALRFNTAISQLMVFVNHFTRHGRRPRRCLRPFVQLLHPFAPHLAEELWELLGERELLARAPWPDFDPQLARDELITVAVQVLGKTRGQVEVEPGASQQEVEQLARQVPTVRNHLEGRTVRKVVFVPDRIINFVVS
ncbi:MAG: leucine--tRNA ligase [Myxococcales bacterium]|nr:leucine--tRNA ligase [Myxococcota bacterium]MDW8284405.1 leucine--tRNA ligase [Myxococcales bacterium]